jgi:transcriptional regulator with XRE-family HTH domain
MELGLSQEELAARADLHRNFVGALERGEKSPTLDVIEALAEALHQRPHDLLREAERNADR